MDNNFRLWSSEFSDNGVLTKDHEFNSFGGNGKNLSPEIEWNNPPVDTKSFALTVYDPDAPTGSGFWHWVLLNISSDVRKLEQNAGDLANKLAPSGALQILNDYGFQGFGGACPPIGDKPHQYEFSLHALNIEKLDVDEKCTNAVARFLINQHSIEKVKIVAHYQR